VTAPGDGAEDPVLYEVDRGVALLTWNRPERNNAWSPELEESYFGRLRQAEADHAVRAIVVTGAGRHFCPGTDIRHLASVADGNRHGDPELREPQTLPTTILKPIIAAINGSCAGTGFIQASVCDVRFADADARITPAFVRRGIMAEHGLAFLLPRLVGLGSALDILLSARVLSGVEAHRIGLVNHLSEPGNVVEDALAYARDLGASCSPIAMAVTKQQVYSLLSEPLEAARTAALDHWQRLREHGDFAEGVRSFREHRPPGFAPVDLDGPAGRLLLGRLTAAHDGPPPGGSGPAHARTVAPPAVDGRKGE
jgi:enoyl-CoA hydratase/carnithine racemase